MTDPIGAMLPTEVREAPIWLSDPTIWVVQPKWDGHRVLIPLHTGEILNRHGKPYGHPFDLDVPKRGWRNESLVLDGEWLPQLGQCVLFDAFSLDFPDWPFTQRQQILLDLDFPEGYSVCDYAYRRSGQRLVAEAEANPNCDGVVYKDTRSLYRPFERAREWQKVKFADSIEAYVMDISPTGRSSCSLAVHDPFTGTDFHIANASTAGKPALKVGDVVEVRFLRLMKNGKLREPRIVRIRHDKTIVDCTVEQLVPHMPA